MPATPHQTVVFELKLTQDHPNNLSIAPDKIHSSPNGIVNRSKMTEKKEKKKKAWARSLIRLEKSGQMVVGYLKELKVMQFR